MSKPDKYLFDTHALIFWHSELVVSKEFIDFFDSQEEKGTLYFSSISIWETALLKRKGRIRLDVDEFLNDLLLKTGINLLEPTCTEMIASTLLPDFHKDPFDRLLVSQARQNRLVLVTQDKRISEYDIKSFWI